jgi:DNA-binding transcriptional regulator YdaS (Cro superfamily)
MNQDDHPLDRAARIRGGREQLAKDLSVTPAAIGNWKSRGTPIEHCAEIERLCERGVTRIQLRPKDWQRIWPELADDLEEAAHVHTVGALGSPADTQGVAHG